MNENQVKIFSFPDLLGFYRDYNLPGTENSITVSGNNRILPALYLLEGNDYSGREIVVRELIRSKQLNRQEMKLIYFPLARELRHLLADILCTAIGVKVQDDDDSINSRMDFLCQDAPVERKRFRRLLELLGLTERNYYIEISSRESEKNICREFGLFLNFLAAKIYHLKRGNLIITIHNAEFVEPVSLKLLLHILNTTAFDVPFFVFITYSPTGFVREFFATANLSQQNIVTAKRTIEECSYDTTQYLIDLNVTEDTPESTRDELLRNSGNSIIAAAELLNIYKISRGYIEDAMPYPELILAKIAVLTPEAKRLINYLIFFEGFVFEEYLPLIFPNQDIKAIDNVVNELYNTAFVVFKNHDLYFSSMRLFAFLKDRFDEVDFLAASQGAINHLLKVVFSINKRDYHYLLNFYGKMAKSRRELHSKILLTKYDNEENFVEMLRIIENIDWQLVGSDDEKMDLIFKKMTALFGLEKYELLLAYLTGENIERELTKNIGFQIQIYFYLAKAYLGLKQDAMAEKNLYKALALIKENNIGSLANPVKEALGDFYRERNTPAKAKQYYADALNGYKKEMHNLKISEIYYKSAQVQQLSGLYETGCEELELSLIFYNRLPNIPLSRLYGEINLLAGRLYFARKNYLAAEKYYCRAVEVFETLEDNNLLIRTYFSAGELYHALGDMEKASAYLHESIRVASENASMSSLTEINYFLAKFNLYNHNLDRSRINTIKGLQLAVRHNLPEDFLKFMELMGDLNWFERNYILAERCYKYVIKERQHNKQRYELPPVMFKFARLYAATGNFVKSQAIIQRFEKADFHYYLTNDNEFIHNNIMIENYISQQNFDLAGQYLALQDKLSAERKIHGREKAEYLALAAVYHFLTDDLEKGYQCFTDCNTICQEKQLYLEEISAQIQIAGVLEKLGYRRDALRCLVSVLPNTRKIRSTQLAKTVQQQIYKL